MEQLAGCDAGGRIPALVCYHPGWISRVWACLHSIGRLVSFLAGAAEDSIRVSCWRCSTRTNRRNM